MMAATTMHASDAATIAVTAASVDVPHEQRTLRPISNVAALAAVIFRQSQYRTNPLTSLRRIGCDIVPLDR